MFEQIPNSSTCVRTTMFAESFALFYFQKFDFLFHLFEHVFLLLMVFVLTTKLQIIFVDAPINQIVVKRNDTNIVDEMQFARSIEIDHGRE